MTTNLSECFNGVLKGAHSLPITAMVQYIFFKLVSYFDARRNQTQAQLDDGQVFSKYAIDIFEKNKEKATKHGPVNRYDRRSGIFDVQTLVNAFSANRGNHIQVVNLFEKNCTYGKMAIVQDPLFTCNRSLQQCER